MMFNVNLLNTKVLIFSIIITLVFTTSSNAQEIPAVQFEKIEGKKLAYFEEGEGEVIVLLHGWPQTSFVWRKVMPQLSEKYHVIAIDLPGLGESDFISDYSTANVSNIIHRFMQQKGIEKFHLVGHDLGTWVALTYALQFEETLNTLTLVDAGIPGLMDEKVFQPENANKIWQFYFHGINDLPEILTKDKEDVYLNWYFDTKSYIKTAISDADKSVYYQSYIKKGKMEAGFNYYRAFLANSTFNKVNIRILKVPILAIGGEFALSKSVGNALIPYSTKLTNISMPNTGHYVVEEQPEIFIDHLFNFIK